MIDYACKLLLAAIFFIIWHVRSDGGCLSRSRLVPVELQLLANGV